MSKSTRKRVVKNPEGQVDKPVRSRRKTVKQPGSQIDNESVARSNEPKEAAPLANITQKPAATDTPENSLSVIPAAQPENETIMEVHHHPQLEHKPKPFKEYLLEGFMIFIAVMMGFIAENIREAIDNNEQVHQLTSQLAQDLKADSRTLDTIYDQESQILKSNDSLFAIAQQPIAKLDTRKLQKLVIDSHSLWLFHPSGGAIGAIKNQLHLKRFSNSKIIGYIARYERHIEMVRTVQDITLQYQRSYLDPFLRLHFTPANLFTDFNHGQPTAAMRDLTQSDLTQLAADMSLVRINTYELLLDNRRLKTDAVALLNYVKQEYGAEE